MNTIKLNTLGDKVIVRKAAENGGNAGGDTGGGAPSGGKVFEPNGWCWSIDPSKLSNSMTITQLYMFFMEYGRIYDGIHEFNDGLFKNDDRESAVIITRLLEDNSVSRKPRYIREAKGFGCFVNKTYMVAESLYDILCVAFGAMTEDEFVVQMASVGLTRISNEEYEDIFNSLIYEEEYTS